MDHLIYIMASYAITVVLTMAYSIAAFVRMGRARKRLAAIDPRTRDMGRDAQGGIGRQTGHQRG
jgi:hypothetical protein